MQFDTPPMQCAMGGHDLTVPYMFITGFEVIGRMTPQMQKMLREYMRWANAGSPADHYCFCFGEFMLLLFLMELYRLQDPEVMALLDQRLAELAGAPMEEAPHDAHHDEDHHKSKRERR